MSENDIRDQLAEKLSMIEPSLSFIAKEYRLENDHGAGGRVDILARDATGSFVVIELKRSNVAARQALHELAKYVELFRRKKGISTAKLRVLIVSTEWRELLVPFSHAFREWSVDLRGYRLSVDSDGITPVAAQRVQPLIEAPILELTPIQLLVQSGNGDLDAIWEWVLGQLTDLGVENLVGLEFRHPEYDDGIYFIFGQVDPGTDVAVELGRRAEQNDYDLSDAPDDYQPEYIALYYLCQEFAGYTVEEGSPIKLSSLLQSPAWQLGSVRRNGIFQDSLIFPDSDLARDSSSTGGVSNIALDEVANTEHRERWERFVGRVQMTLAGNEAWSMAVSGWLKEVAESAQPAEVSAKIFNPCDLVSAFAFGWPDRIDQYLPAMKLEARSGGKSRTLEGFLVSNRTYRSVHLAFEQVYGDVMNWGLGQSAGNSWDLDSEFLEQLGVRYAAFEYEVRSGDVAQINCSLSEIVRRAPEQVIDGNPIWCDFERLEDLLQRHVHDFNHFSAMLAQHIRIPSEG